MFIARKILFTAGALLVLALVVAVSPLRQPVTQAASNLSVTVSNTSANPVPVSFGNSGSNPLPVTLGNTASNPLNVSQAPGQPGQITFTFSGLVGQGSGCATAMTPAHERFVMQSLTAHMLLPTGQEVISAIIQLHSRDLTTTSSTGLVNLNFVPVDVSSTSGSDDWVANQMVTAYAEPNTQIQVCTDRGGTVSGTFGFSATIFGYLVSAQ